jgi:8-oxo-dGTP pyrophosphatase MutT (NUDIX family)
MSMTNSSPITAYKNNERPSVALAILYRENQFLLQLRDNIPNILYPGYWGLFGGHIEIGEDPTEAVKREVWEEIDYQLKTFYPFGCYQDEQAIRHVFHAPLTVSLDQLTLQEGWDFALISAEEILQGEIYSIKAEEKHPLGEIHQRILRDFLKAELH